MYLNNNNQRMHERTKEIVGGVVILWVNRRLRIKDDGICTQNSTVASGRDEEVCEGSSIHCCLKSLRRSSQGVN